MIHKKNAVPWQDAFHYYRKFPWFLSLPNHSQVSGSQIYFTRLSTALLSLFPFSQSKISRISVTKTVPGDSIRDLLIPLKVTIPRFSFERVT